MGETAFNLVPQEDEVTREVATVETQAKELKVVDAASYIAAGELWKAIKALRAKIKDTFGPIKEAANKAHKMAVAKEKEVDAPLEAAERIVKRGMSEYDQIQEVLRQAEQRRLEEIARKAAEEQALMDAIQAEEQAKRNGATKAEAAQEAAAIIDTPVYVPPVVLPKTTPKMAGGPVYRTVWKFRIKNAALIPRQYLIPDEVRIGQIVRADKKETNIPGVEVYEERC